MMPAINVCQIKVERKTYNELLEIGKQLERETFVRMASPDLAYKVAYASVPDDPWDALPY